MKSFVPVCPVDPSHGRLLDWNGEGGRDLYCPHVAHAGRPRSHPQGEAPPTRAFFRAAEVEVPR